eukprot:scaffold17595_cov113-Cylindrotheca_fusiformis.AAC.10
MSASCESLPTPTSGLSASEAKNGKLWNRYADKYSKQPIKDKESYEAKLRLTREYLSPQSNVLEFGCGTGSTAILHAPYVKSIHAIDVSSSMIEIAQSKAEEANVDNVQFECSGIDSLIIATENGGGAVFDAVLGLNVLHLLPNKDEAIQKVHTLLKPGGFFISSTFCIGDFARYIGWFASGLSRFGIVPDINIFTKEDLIASMEKAGFKIEQEFHPDNGNKAVFLVARKV